MSLIDVLPWCFLLTFAVGRWCGKVSERARWLDVVADARDQPQPFERVVDHAIGASGVERA